MAKVSAGSRGAAAVGCGAALALTVVSLLHACAPATATTPRPAGEPWIAGNPAAAGPVGSRVLVERNQRWLPATIAGHDDASGRVLVHYQGFGSEWDELVTSDRVRPDTGTDAPPASDYQLGEPVLIELRSGRLVLAVVVAQLSSHAWRVQYQGYGPEATEVVAPPSMRRPHAGPSALHPGQRVFVDVGGSSPAPGTVIAVVTEQRWLVRFEGAGPEQDREIRPYEIRGAADTPPTQAPSAADAGPSSGH